MPRAAIAGSGARGGAVGTRLGTIDIVMAMSVISVQADAVLHLIATIRAAGRAALAREDLEVEERLLAAFEAMHGSIAGQPATTHMNELRETAKQLVGPVVDEVDQSLVSDVARVLRSAGIAAAWKSAAVSAKDLAEHLCAASHGVKHAVATAAEYRDRMRVAVRIVCRGGPGRSE